jgi:hypothetical protein
VVIFVPEDHRLTHTTETSRSRVSFSSKVITSDTILPRPWCSSSHAVMPRRPSLKDSNASSSAPSGRKAPFEPGSVVFLHNMRGRYSYPLRLLQHQSTPLSFPLHNTIPPLAPSTPVRRKSAALPLPLHDFAPPEPLTPDPLDFLPPRRADEEPHTRPRGPTWNKFLNRKLTPPGEVGDELLLVPRPNVLFLSEQDFDVWATERGKRPKTDRSVFKDG